MNTLEVENKQITQLKNNLFLLNDIRNNKEFQKLKKDYEELL